MDASFPNEGMFGRRGFGREQRPPFVMWVPTDDGASGDGPGDRDDGTARSTARAARLR